MHMGVNPSIRKVVARVGDIPAMSEVVLEVMELTEDPNVAISEVSCVIERDPALTIKLLKVSNSSFYGMRQVVGTLKLALVILGVREVRNIVLGISVLDAFTAGADPIMKQGGLWQHSVTVAGITKRLGNYLELSFQGEDFIAGLLHDIGKLVLWKQLGEDYKDIYKAAAVKNINLYELEFENFGFDHADAAGALGELWDLPPSLCGALWCHHPREDRPIAEARDPKLAALVRIANQAVHDDLAADEPGVCVSCQDEEAWAILATVAGVLSPDARLELLLEFSRELRDTQALTL